MSIEDLYDKCTSCDWDSVRIILKDFPEEACEPIVTGKRGAAKITVLQVVLAHPKCKGSVPLDVIATVLKIAPHLAELRHSHTGNLPLHAVFYNAFFSSAKRAKIADMIISANPNSVLLRNYEGKTPLHTNCTQHCNYDPVVALLRAAPQIAKWRDKNGELPLHLACRSQKTPNKSIKTLFDAYPDGIFTKNGNGLKPLEIARSSKVIEQRKNSRISLLVTLEEDYAKVRKAQGKLVETHRPINKRQEARHTVQQVAAAPVHPQSTLLQQMQHIPPYQYLKDFERGVMWSPYQNNDLLHTRGRQEPLRYSSENVMIMEALRQKQGYFTEDLMLMDAYRQKQAYLELLRQHQIVVSPEPVQAEESCADALLALKTKEEF